MAEVADTVPGFTMQSESFYLKFVTGMQCGVSSKLLEYETDWYEVMEILLSRLEDQPENQPDLERIAGRDLEFWAAVQPGGDTLNLKIQVRLEEKRYFLPPLGMRKMLKLAFNDRFTTQVLFHVKKKQQLQSLLLLSSVAVAASLRVESHAKVLGGRGDLPLTLVPAVQKAWNNCWTARYFSARLPGCPELCACKLWQGGGLRKGKKITSSPAEKGKKMTSSTVKKGKKMTSSPAEKGKKSLSELYSERKSQPSSNIKFKLSRTKVKENKEEVEEREKLAKDADGVKMEGKRTKLNNKVKVLESEINKLEIDGRNGSKEKEETIRREFAGNEHESEYAKLQHKYETMQAKYKELKKERTNKMNLQTLQQKYKALETKFKNLKQREKVVKEAVIIEQSESSKECLKQELSISTDTHTISRSKAVMSNHAETPKAPKKSKVKDYVKSPKISAPLYLCVKCGLNFALSTILKKHMKAGCVKASPEPPLKKSKQG